MRIDFAFLRRGQERIPGGKASGMPASRFDAKQLRVGTKVEMEHTTDADLAKEIAKDHLVEDPLYYKKLLRAGL